MITALRRGFAKVSAHWHNIGMVKRWLYLAFKLVTLQWCKTETLERLAYITTIAGFFVLVFSIIILYLQIDDVRRIAKAQNNIALSVGFVNRANTGIIHAIEYHKPILVEHGGHYNTTDLDNYLGYFETIDQAYRLRLLTEADLCTSFSTYIVEVLNDKEVKKYLADNPGYFSGLTELNNIITKSRDSDCHTFGQ